VLKFLMNPLPAPIATGDENTALSKNITCRLWTATSGPKRRRMRRTVSVLASSAFPASPSSLASLASLPSSRLWTCVHACTCLVS
jgi:hypothetical protein